MLSYPLLKILVERGIIPKSYESSFSELYLTAQKEGLTLFRFLASGEAFSEINEELLLKLAAENLQTEYLEEITQANIDNELILRFPYAFLKTHKLVPIRTKLGLTLALADPISAQHLMSISLLVGEKVSYVFAKAQTIQELIDNSFGASMSSGVASGEIFDALESKEADILAPFEDNRLSDLLEDESEAPFIKLVNLVIAQAVKAKASDIHFEPYQDSLRIRFRLDGVLYDKHVLSKRYHAAIISRIKIMASLNIAEKRLPQDGRIALTMGGRQIDLRVSSLPTSHGERIVLRLLEKSAKVFSLSELGLDNADLDYVKDLISLPNGIVLVTGPTGSGKTTTLYAALSSINTPDKNILTIEDPVEYQIQGLGQMQVNPKIDLSFATGLRTLLRQDPDVILIGEIRDKETAEIAIQAALTGHLVFSTLHTNDAPSAITRLMDMGLEPFLLSSVIRGIIAQRLVRVLCPHCKTPVIHSDLELQELGEDANIVRGKTCYLPCGCVACNNTGFQGRNAVYELMPITDMVKQTILRADDASNIKEVAMQEGMSSLRKDACRKMANGVTSLSEILRVINL